MSLLLVAGLLASSCGDGSEPGPEELDRDEQRFEYALPLNPYDLTGAELTRALDLAEEAGVNSIFVGANWWYIVPERSTEDYRLDPLDRLVEETQRRGLKLSLQISGTPDWVHPELERRVPDQSERIWYPPTEERDVREFGRFVGFIVDRYGTQVERYEIWNEPNSVDFWKPEPDAEEYAFLLRTGYQSAKDANPRVTVSFGGISMNDLGYLASYYEAAGVYPDAAAQDHFFDVLDVHPYTYAKPPDWHPPVGRISLGEHGPIDRSFKGIVEMKLVMDKNGDEHKNIFLGEFGYSTSETWMEAVPDRQRAEYLVRAYEIARGMPYVLGMCWYAYLSGDSVGPEWAIVSEDFETSRSYAALKRVTGAGKNTPSG